MAGRKTPKDLSALPLHIRKKNKHWWKDHRTGKLIHNSNIHLHLPKPETDHEQIINQRWDLKY